jgi:hypothetical protein
MIKSLYSTSPFITVAGGTPQNTYIGHSNGPGVGNMRYNPNGNNIEVFDGASWVVMYGSNATVDLSGEAISLLEWARKKRNEELELERLAETNPTIKDLMDQIKQKQEQLSIVQTLIKEEVKV